MDKTKIILQAAGIAVTIGGAVLSIIGGIISDKQLDIKIDEKVREVVGTD